jgi:hypothetical protein
VTVQNGSGNISGNNNMILNTPPTTGQPKGDAIPFSDQEVHGRLQPGNEPTPPNACSGSPGAEPMKVLIGGNAFVKDGFGKLTALKVGLRSSIDGTNPARNLCERRPLSSEWPVCS